MAPIEFQLMTRIIRSVPVMRVIVLHPYSKFEVRRPFRSKDMAEFLSRRYAA